jgi:hypothetical protein
MVLVISRTKKNLPLLVKEPEKNLHLSVKEPEKNCGFLGTSFF